MIDRNALIKEQAQLRARLKQIGRILEKHKTGKSVPDYPKRWHTYVLLCDDGHYYIGITTNINRRFKQHLSGKASWFTKVHKPIEVLETTPLGKMKTSEAAILENKLAASYIKEHGYHKVRGGGFIQKDPRHFLELLNRYGEVTELTLDDQFLDLMERTN